MNWPRRLSLWNPFKTGCHICWLAVIIGVVTTIFLHYKHKKALFWPAIAAFCIYYGCEIGEINVFHYSWGFIFMFIGSGVFFFAAAWLIMDIIILMKKVIAHWTGSCMLQ